MHSSRRMPPVLQSVRGAGRWRRAAASVSRRMHRLAGPRGLLLVPAEVHVDIPSTPGIRYPADAATGDIRLHHYCARWQNRRLLVDGPMA